MNCFVVIVSSCLLLVDLVSLASLPSYITPCSRTDPDLSGCVLKTGRQILKQFSKADPELGLKSLDPLYVGRVQISKKKPGNGIGITIDNTYIEGLGSSELQNMTVNEKERWIGVRFKATVIVKGDYEVDGKILLLPINGNGDMNLKIRDTVCDYIHQFAIYKDNIEENHLRIADDNLKCTYGRTTFRLNNLFGGNKQLSDNMNKILSDNWKEVMKEVSPPVLDAIQSGVKNRINDFYSKVPFEALMTV